MESARALHEVHQAGVIHCDFKIDNLVVDSGPDNCRVFLIDFGLATTIGSYGQFWGLDPAERAPDSHYAPELYTGTPPSPASDTYSLGTMMKAVLSTLVHERVMTEVDPLVADLCKIMTENDPALRPSLTQVVSLLQHITDVLARGPKQGMDDDDKDKEGETEEERDDETDEDKDSETDDYRDGNKRSRPWDDEEDDDGPRKRQATEDQRGSADMDLPWTLLIPIISME